MDAPTPTQTTAPPKCTTAIPDKYGFVPPDSCNANYGFYPSWEWNLVFAIAFALTSLAHVVQAIIFRKASRQSNMHTGAACPDLFLSDRT